MANFAENAVRYALEMHKAEELKSYIDRGRKLADLPLVELSSIYVEAFRAWSNNPELTAAATGISDAMAEYALRDELEPRHLTTEYSDLVTNHIKNHWHQSGLDCSASANIINNYQSFLDYGKN